MGGSPRGEPLFLGLGAVSHGHSRERRRYFDMGILTTIIIGFVVGIVAKLLMPGRDPGGFIITILLGIAGSFVANFLGHEMGWYGEGETAGFIASVVGAIILLLIYRLVLGRRRA